MRRLHSSFEVAETFIAKGQSVDSFMPALFINNTCEKPLCKLVDVTYLRLHIANTLFPLHWAEVAQDKSWACDINWEYYYSLEALKMLQIVVLTVGERPVGYFIFVLSPALHYQSKILASSDMFYMLPAYRAQYAVRLFRAAEAYAKAAGAHKMYIAFKIYKDISALTKRLGFTEVEHVVVKSLE